LSYTKTTWSDKAIQFVRRYTLGLVSGSTYDLTPVEGTVTNAGTAITAARMNNIETGIENGAVAADIYKYNNFGGAL